MDPGHVAGQRDGFVLEQTRIFDAPAERVFGLLTEPTELTKWWGPHGFSTPAVQIDLRVGGSYRFTMQPPEGEAFHLSGEFLEVQAPSVLRFTFRWDEPVPDDRETVVELTLDPLGERTKVTLTQKRFATDERLALHRGGWADSFEKLDTILGAVKRRGRATASGVRRQPERR
jgi:uncharacterized protein YndB with AHSA1/START domain